MKLLEVILIETTIYQDTAWKKKGLDWNDFPAEFVRLNPTNRTTEKANTVDEIKTELEAWRKINPKDRPEQAWTFLKGKGPAPEPEKEIKGADLRIEPPDDSGDWIDFGDKWQNTKMTPTGFAIKPNPRRPTTWGPNWKSADQQIADIKNKNKKISDEEVTKQLKDLHDSRGRRKYSDKEIAEAWAIIKQYDVIDKIQDQFVIPRPKYNKETKTWSCKDGWTYDPAKKICVKPEVADPNEPAPEPYPGADGKPTCTTGWTYDAKADACVRNTSVVVTPEPERKTDEPPEPIIDVTTGKSTCNAPWIYDEKTKSCVKKTETTPPVTTTPPKPVAGPDGKFRCEPPWVYDETTKSCVKKTETPSGEINLEWPAGTKNNLNTNNPFGNNGGRHKGIDIAVSPGTFVVAPENGTVTKLPRLNNKGAPIYDDRGLFIEFTSSDGNRIHKFFHLLTVNESAGISTTWSKGQRIAKSGGLQGHETAGNAKGLGHLHWEVWVEGSPVDPMSFFKKNGE